MFLPLRGLGNVLIGWMAAIVAAITVRLAVEEFSLGSPHWRSDFIYYRLDKATDLAMFGFGIMFVVWLRRARVNAERSGWRQRRASGWTFWGWLVPIVSLWFPFQVMGDIWRAGLPADRRRRTAWLPVLWWTTWLLSGIHTGRAADDYPEPMLTSHSLNLGTALLAVSGLALIAIIYRISRGPVGQAWPDIAEPVPLADLV